MLTVGEESWEPVMNCPLAGMLLKEELKFDEEEDVDGLWFPGAA